MTACKNENITVVKLLLKHGADGHLGWGLTEAIFNRHTEIIQLLSNYGAQVDDDFYWHDRPPLVAASMEGKTQIVKLLLAHGAEEYLGWALAMAVKHKHTEVVDLLLEYGTGVDLSVGYLTTIVEAGEDMVKLFLDKGARVDIAEANGSTALIIASKHGHSDVVKLLLDKGAQVDITESDGCTALIIASQNGHSDVVKLLLDKGAQVDIAEADGWTALLRASGNGHLEVVKLLLDKGAQVDITESDGCTALIIASQNGHLEVVKLLLDKGAQVDITESDGRTALIIASENGHSDVVKLLLDKGAQLDITNTNGWTALIIASQNGHSDVVKLLLDKGAQVDITESDGCTAFIIASENGHLDVVKLLLDKGAQVDIAEADGWTALIRASGKGHSDVVKLLLDKGAQVDITNTNGSTALIIASQNGHSDVVKLLLDKGARIDITNTNGTTALIRASGNGHSDVVKLLLDIGAQVDIAEADGWTALIRASGKGHSDVVKLLLDKGAQVDITNTNGSTALIIASQNGHSDVVKLLLDKGARIDITNTNGTTALIRASGNGHSDVVKLLLDKGAQVDITNTNGWTALIRASGNGHSDVVKLLLDKGAQVDITEADGWTALMSASFFGHSDVVKLLLDKGAQVDFTKANGSTALIIASENGHLEVVKLLLDKGAQVNVTKTNGSTALTRASKNGHSDVVKLLLDKGAPINLQDSKGWSLVVRASKNVQTQLIKLLLEYGQQNQQSIVNLSKFSIETDELLLECCSKENLQSALILACQRGNADITGLFLNVGAQVNAEISKTYAILEASKNGHIEAVKLLLYHGAKLHTALIEASRNGHVEVVKLLVVRGARVDIQDSDGHIALIVASENGHIPVVKILLQYNALVNWQDNDGRSALMLACQNGHTEITKMLLEYDARVNLQDNNGFTALMKASDSGHAQILHMLIQSDVFIDQQNHNGSSALFCASSSGHTEVVKLLLEHGSSSNLGDNKGRSVLMIACRNGHYQVVRLLLEHGDQEDKQDNDGVTALMLASQEGHHEIVHLLIQYGFNVQAQDKNGANALMKASNSGHSDVAKLLLKCGANVNQQSSDGSSPLMLACCSGHAKTVETLIEYGAQTDLQNHDGWSPLMKASQAGRTDVVKLLLEHEAQVNLQSKDGSYALMVASEEGYIEVVKQLLKHGSQVDLKDNIGRTAITAARNTDILLALFAFKPDLPEIGSLDDSDTQHESLDEKEQGQHLIAIENAIRDRGQLDHTLVHGVFVGPPRSGKDSLMKRLLGEQITNDSPSTGVAENVVHVKVEESSTFAATVDQSNWARLAYDEEAVHLMKTASNKNSNISHLPKEFSDEKGIAESTDLVLKEIEKTAQQTQEKSAQNNTTSGKESLMLQFMSPLEEIFQPPEHPELQVSRQHKSPMEIFKEALKSKGLEGLKKQLLKSWSLYLTNTGGQMEFQELLPLLVSGPSIFFITFQLHKDLNQHFSVEYELPSGESSKSYQSSLSILESILQTLSSISAMGTYVYKDLQRKVVPLRPKVFIIGTHKDLLNKKTAAIDIKSIDQHLQAVIKPTSHYREGIIQFASESQMIFAVNNHDPDDSDFKRIRTAVEKVVETGDYRMRSPAHWMIYSLVVRQLQNRIESYDECFAIAKECGIRDTNEFNEALHFIHTKMGLVRYFPHEDLKDLIIVDPQILFEKVTELIVETFTFEKDYKLSNVEIFKNMGIFNLSDFIRISSRTGQNLTAPLFAQLLEHLRIAARFQQNSETKYFLPCVLTHAQAKQSDDTSILPPLIVAFQCGYCPKGLFGTLITYLISNEMQSDFEWEFDTEKIYRDEVCFQVGPYDTVTIRFLPTHLEITCVDSNPKVLRINCTKESICQEVFQSVEKGIKAVTSAIKYINAQHSFTFYCTSESCSKESHPAKLKKLKGKSCSLRCERLKQCFPLPSGYDKWQLDSSSQISEPAKGTASVPHVESCTRLEKEHHAQLFEQLSRCAAEWKNIGLYLGFHSGELDNIAAKLSLLHEGTEGYLREMLSKYLEWVPGDQRGNKQYATLEALKRAVDKAGLGATAADLTICVGTTDSITSRDHDLSHSATASVIRSGNKRNKECTEEPSPKRPRWEST